MLGQLTALIPDNIDVLLLVFTRLSGLFVSSNIYSRRGIPNVVKIGYAAALTFVVIYAFPPSAPLAYATVWAYALMVIKELLLGLVFGFVMNLFFMITAFVSGHIIDMHMGFGMVNVFDVTSNASVSVTGNVLNILLMLMYFLLNCHGRVIYIMQLSFEWMPAGAISVSPRLAVLIVQLVAQCFVLALNVSMPFIAAGLLFELSMGVIIRTVPQMNMFVVGMPMKVLLGLLLLMVTIPLYAAFSQTVFTEMFSGLERMFEGFLPA